MSPTALMISKPVVPPWNDSSKNLVRDLATSGTRFTYRVLATPEHPLAGPAVVSEPLYREGGRFSPAALQNARVLARLLRRDDTALAHFFFAPNPRTSLAARAALRLRPRVTLQTVCSVPRSLDRVTRLLFGQRVVVLSRHTEQALLGAGMPPARLVRIPPGIHIPPLPSPEERRRARLDHGLPPEGQVVIYPGDYQFSRAAETFVRAILQLQDLPATFVLACRMKGEASLAEERRLRALLADAGQLGRVHFLGEVPDMPRLVAAVDLCALPAESLYAKMDLPLVLLEALALGIPLVVTDRGPLAELLEHGEVGLGVSPLDPAALAGAVRQILTEPGRREALASKARAVARARFDITAISRQHEDLYLELLQR